MSLSDLDPGKARELVAAFNRKIDDLVELASNCSGLKRQRQEEGKVAFIKRVLATLGKRDVEMRPCAQEIIEDAKLAEN